MATKGEISYATQESSNDLAVQYYEEWKKWRAELEPYWPEIDKAQEMYEFYKREYSETSAEITLNTPFSIIESMVARFNDTTLTVTAKALGLDGLDEFEEYTSSLTHDSFEDPDVAFYKGSFRKLKEMGAREFLAKGNLFVEDNYFHKVDEKTDKVLADNPYGQILPFKSYTFNPAYAADESPVQYLEKHVAYSDLKKQEERDVEKPNPDGKPVKTKKGLYKNLTELKRLAEKAEKIIDAQDEYYYSDGKKISRKVEPITLLERWEGAKLCVIACIGNGKTIIREAIDPKKTGNSGIYVAMNYKIAGRPYAYGEVTPIYRLVRAQDTVVSQDIEVINRYLRPTVFVNDTEADLDSIVLLMERGGAGFGDYTKIGSPQLNLPPGQAFQSIDMLQQAIERTARYSPYANGGTSQVTDKTQGTATGIQALQTAAEPNFQVKIDALQDSWLRPSARNRLKMIANVMSPVDIRYTYLRGQEPKWVQATKGILMGQATIGDMVTVGMIKPQELEDPAFVSELLAEFQLTDPQQLLEETVIFDTDWIIDVKLDSQSAADKEADLNAEIGIIQFGQQLGVQYSPERTATYFAHKRNFARHDDLMLTEEEKQQQQQEILTQQAQQMQQQQVAAGQEQAAQGQQSSEQAKQDEVARLEEQANALEQGLLQHQSALAQQQTRAGVR